jgi:alpha-galactosidase
MKKRFLITAVAIILILNGFTQTKKLAQTPPMGWNSWNYFGKPNINETLIKECIDAIVDNGLLNAGYEYVVIDGGWRDTKLGSKGELLAHPVKFPSGIKALADYAHLKGLKFGLHVVPGTHDCGGDLVGGLGHEEVHVKQFAEWGLDFIKLDRCRNDNGWTEENLKASYQKWQKLLENCGRDIVYNISAYDFRGWNPEVCHMSRTTYDIAARVANGAKFDYEEKVKNFLSVMQVAEENSESAQFARPGYWNDPDMMVTGDHGLTIEEQKAHFALWCIMSAPLFLGNDPRSMTLEEREIVTNEMAILINQDPTEQGIRIKKTGKAEVWQKKLTNGNRALLLLNRNSVNTEKIVVSLNELGINRKVGIHDIFLKKDTGTVKNKIECKVEPHSCVFLLINSK